MKWGAVCRMPQNRDPGAGDMEAFILGDCVLVAWPREIPKLVVT